MSIYELEVQKIKDSIDNIFARNKDLNTLISNILLSEGDIYLVGGAVRDIGFFNTSPRDLDFIVDTDEEDLSKYLLEYSYIRNSYGGYKVFLKDIEIDIWTLPSTFVFKMGILTPNIENFLYTPILSIDSIIYNIKNSKLLSDGFFESYKNKEIFWIRNPISDEEYAINIVKSMISSQKYSFIISDVAKQTMKTWLNEDKSQKIILLNKSSLHHYKKDIDLNFLIGEYLD